ncbi:hypothetical protein CA600_27890 [Paenibacillus sp. VTT E-133280]|uniref:ABC-three component system middle component 1 n=1 Tax=Paenibacillus sp. VTT E-133280 TaxID=1986222 RepID=UPI000B9FF0DD|nr:ABC-three component system middle component 1 [Paenibacillus sp. VTT E-133280]OZQ60556.1 hypothetical protein CA600_27890 [Paenibacillus sp. VTT E-133280]
MIRLMQKLFEENDFGIRHFLHIPTNVFGLDNPRGSYYLAVFLEEDESYESLTADMFNSYYDVIKGLQDGYDPQMDKNLSLLICLKRKVLEPDHKLNKIIFDIEEDPYFFKKYVLTYTELQVEKILTSLSDSGLMDYIHRILNDEAIFQSHKIRPHVESEYNLISRLFIKLPFLDLRKMDRELSNLRKDITDLLTPELLKLRDDIVHLRPKETMNEEIFRNLILKYVEVEKE